MNAITVLAGLLLYGLSSEMAFACELCKQNQPDALQGISHGTGPQAGTDYIIIWCALVLVAIALGLRVRRGADRTIVAAVAIAVVAVALHVAEILLA